MRQSDGREDFEGFLWGELVLVTLLGGALALFLTNQSLRETWDLPELRLTLTTLYAVGGGLVALLTASRFTTEGRLYDLLLCTGFLTGSLAWTAFSIAPRLADLDDHPAMTWAGLAGVLLGWTLVALAPFVGRRVEKRRTVLVALIGAVVPVLALIWIVAQVGVASLPDVNAQGGEPVLVSVTLALLALVNLIALIGFGYRFRKHGGDLDRWLALGSTLMLFAALHFVFAPPAATAFVSQGDYLRVLAFAVLVVGVWREIRSSDLRRAVAEERARVARDIHDGLAQYLFAVRMHISMLENGTGREDTLPRLKEAALAAQQEARFAVLALSSAAGSAPFDAALRRYVDLFTADGNLEVELEVDTEIVLAPDEQIEIFRIVQESLANARRHGGALSAHVTIGRSGSDRLISITDDGVGFDVEASGNGAGQGLRNMRQRAVTIGGTLSLVSAPGRGTALGVVLRS